MTDIISIAASLITGFSAGFLSHKFASRRNRENDLSKVKLQAYSDFIRSATRLAASRRLGNEDNDLNDLANVNDAKNRIILSGDIAVVESLITFWRRGGTLENESELLAFRNLIREMRKSIGYSSGDLSQIELTDAMFKIEPSTYSYRAAVSKD